MNTKNLMVFFLVLTSILLVANFVAATNIASIDSVKINDIYANADEVAVQAGETITVKVFFTALQTTSDVRLKLLLEGTKLDVDTETASFNIEEGKKYSKTLTLTVPYELQDSVNTAITLSIKMWNGDFRTEFDGISLSVQRPSYNAAIMSISSAQTAEAGQYYPIDIALKNTGYNNLDDLYVTVKIAELGVERTAYLGDLVSIETKHDSDTVSKRFYLQIPYGVKEGSYNIEVSASNADVSVSRSKQIAIKNEFSSNIIVTSTTKAVAVNDDAEFEVILANPTNDLRVFRIVTESTGDITTSANVQLVAIPAGMTKTITVTATPETKGEYNFDVSIFAGEELVDSTTLNVLASGRSASTGSIVSLTIILAIILLVLLGALFLLLRKKPEQNEEFGESYY